MPFSFLSSYSVSQGSKDRGRKAFFEKQQAEGIVNRMKEAPEGGCFFESSYARAITELRLKNRPDQTRICFLKNRGFGEIKLLSPVHRTSHCPEPFCLHTRGSVYQQEL